MDITLTKANLAAMMIEDAVNSNNVRLLVQQIEHECNVDLFVVMAATVETKIRDKGVAGSIVRHERKVAKQSESVTKLLNKRKQL